RGLQTHKTKLDVAQPGSRVAINLTGVSKEDVMRGNIVALPGQIKGTLLFDATYRHLPDADAPLKHNMEVKLFVGAAEMVARTRVLGAQQIEPGEEGWLQLALSEPAAIVRGDRFILRRPSPGATLGGGKVLDPYPGRRHRRFRPDVVQRLQTLTQGTPAELLLQTLRRLEPVSQADLLKQANMDGDAVAAALQTLLDEGEVMALGKQLVSRIGWEQHRDKIRALLAAFHREFPLRLGLSREELRSRLRLPGALFTPLLAQAAADGLLVEAGALVHAPDHQVTFSSQQQAAIDRLFNQLAAAGVNSPSVKECKTAVSEPVYFALIDLGRLRQLAADVVYGSEQYEQIVGQMRAHLQQHGSINAADTRDLLQTSRKYAIAILEHLDEIRLTRRVGDNRELF
ncbi:MAG: SelB C-terminal domain-containing protein, partial [Anaerolineales bacterium]|nr:SelB C-terminal domain-containing protein [Anaerolineales bacterium]